MDADLFTPADTAALLAIRALLSNRQPSQDELQQLFRSAGFLRPGTQSGAAAAACAYRAEEDARI